VGYSTILFNFLFMVEKVCSDVDGGLEDAMSNPEIARIVALVKRNHVVTQIMQDYDHDSVTQGFPEAWMVADAFAGRLKEIPREAVLGDLARLKELWADAIEQEGITDEDLLEDLQMVWVYARFTNPTVKRLEETISVIEGTEDTAVFASGLAAINATIEQFTKPAGLVKMERGNPGEEGYESGEFNEILQAPGKVKEGWRVIEKVDLANKIVVIGSVYGGTFAQSQDMMRQAGREVTYMTISQFIEEGLPDDTDFVHCETSNNPPLRVMPLERVVAEAKRVGELRGRKVYTSFDNTFTPLTVQPAVRGVDFVVHSITKYLGGHSRYLGGSVSGKTENIRQFMNLKHGRRMVYGANMDRGVAREFLESMKDLPERLYRATQNARKVKVIAENFGLEVRHVESDMGEYGWRYNKIRNKKIPQSISNGMINIDFGTVESARQFIDEMVKEGIGKGAVSLGCVKTYYSIPAETTHSEMPRDEQEKVGITPGMVRISCGVESDLVEKFEKVLTRLFSGRAVA